MERGGGEAGRDGPRAPRDRPAAGDDEVRPPLGSWPRLYAAVILNLALLVLLFVLFQRSFR